MLNTLSLSFGLSSDLFVLSFMRDERRLLVDMTLSKKSASRSSFKIEIKQKFSDAFHTFFYDLFLLTSEGITGINQWKVIMLHERWYEWDLRMNKGDDFLWQLRKNGSQLSSSKFFSIDNLIDCMFAVEVRKESDENDREK